MILTVERSKTPVKDIAVENLFCPLSDDVEPMTLILEKAETNAWSMIKIVSKKYHGTYIHNATGNTISQWKWTPEMHQFFQENATANLPVEGAGTKWTLWGKIWISIAIAILVFTAAGLTYEKLIKAPQKDKIYASLAEFPQVGDRYFGHINIFDYQGNKGKNLTGYTWAKVVKTNIKDSTVSLQISAEKPLIMPYAKDANNSNFSEEIYDVKFRNVDQYKIDFRAQDFMFLCTTSNDLEDAKLPKKP